MPTTYDRCTFTDAAGTLWAAASFTTGGPWSANTAIPPSTGYLVTDSTGQRWRFGVSLAASGPSGATELAAPKCAVLPQPGSQDYAVHGQYVYVTTVTTAFQYFLPAVRYSASTDSGVLIIHDTTTSPQRWIIRHFLNGTTVGSESFTVQDAAFNVVADTPFTITLTAVGNVFTLLKDGVVIRSFTSTNAPPTTGVPALRGLTSINGSTSIGLRVMDVAVTAPTDAAPWATATTPTINVVGLTNPAAIVGASPAPQTATITNGGSDTLDGLSLGTVTYGSGWSSGVTLGALSSTTAPATFTETINSVSLAAGTYTYSYPVNSSHSGVASVTVSRTLTVAVAPVLGIDTSEVVISAALGGSPPASIPRSVVNLGGGSLTGLSTSIVYQIGEPTGWLSAVASGGASTVTFIADPTGLTTRVYHAIVTVHATGAADVAIPVRLVVGASGTVGTGATAHVQSRATGAVMVGDGVMRYTIDRTDILLCNPLTGDIVTRPGVTLSEPTTVTVTAETTIRGQVYTGSRTFSANPDI